jgi:long-chain acyl-CoA synthetase
VGGEKVYPAEVESQIQLIDNIAEVTVYGEKNPITGQIVCAKVRLMEEGKQENMKKKIKQYCRKVMPSYKIPVKIHFVCEKQYNDRFKKIRGCFFYRGKLISNSIMKCTQLRISNNS